MIIWGSTIAKNIRFCINSILVSLLFIVYINDIAYITKNVKFTIYADDTTLIEPICTFAHPTLEI